MIGSSHDAHAIELRRINFKVHDFGMRRKAAGIASHPVVQARAENQQQIVFMQRHVGGASAVHAHHAQVIRQPRVRPRPDRELWRKSECSNHPSKLRSSEIAPESFAPAPIKATGRSDFCNNQISLSPNPASTAESEGRGFGREFHRPGKFHLCFQKVGRDIDHHGPGRPSRAQ